MRYIKLTFEQLIASIISNYKTEINCFEVENILLDFCNTMPKDYFFVLERNEYIDNFIINDGMNIWLSHNYNLNSIVKSFDLQDASLKEALDLYAGQTLTDYMKTYSKKLSLKNINI